MKLNRDEVEFNLELDSYHPKGSCFCNNLDLLIIVKLALVDQMLPNTKYFKSYLDNLNL